MYLLCSRGIERVFSTTAPSTEQASAHLSVAVSSTSRFKSLRAAAPSLNRLMRGNHIQPLTIDEALIQLAELIRPARRSEFIPVAKSRGRIVANNTVSPIAVPAFANSAMDGYALRFADLTEAPPQQLTIQGQSLAGHPFNQQLLPNHAIRIFTGAALPSGADTIVIQENTTASNDGQVTLNTHPAQGAYVRPVGHDVGQNSLLLAAGTRMRPFEIASATTSGLIDIEVFEPLKIGVFATGDELRTPGTPLAPGEIYESNRIAITQLLQGMPVIITDLGILPDDADATRQALHAAGLNQDALVTSGGVSVGDADFVRDAISKLGAIDFWRLNLRPGKPFAFGHINASQDNKTTSQDNDRCLIFGLPGNPVSTIVTLLLLVKPALWYMAGSPLAAPQLLRVPLAQPVAHSPGRHEYQRGRLEQQANQSVVTTTSDQSSNRLQSFAGANCLFLLPGDVAELAAGELVDVLLFEGLA